MRFTSLGLRTDVMISKLSGSEIVDRGDHVVVRTSANPTYYWGNFIAVAQPLGTGDGARWLAAFRTDFPAAGHLAIAVDGIGGYAGRADEIRNLGLVVEHSVVLTAERLQPVSKHSPGLRRLRSAQDWSQLLALRRECDQRPDTEEQRRFHERTVPLLRRMSDQGSGAWFGAFVDGRMRAGLGVFSDGSGVARYQHVETHPNYRRQGLATALLHSAAQYAANELGADVLVIVADPADVAIRLYRSVGFRDAETETQLIKEPAERT